MTEITKTIQIYKPEEKLPVLGCRFIAITKRYEFTDKEDTFNVPPECCYGVISFSFGDYHLIDGEAGVTICNEEEFKKNVLEWYYLPM